jgi:hypothetical protein
MARATVLGLRNAMTGLVDRCVAATPVVTGVARGAAVGAARRVIEAGTASVLAAQTLRSSIGGAVARDTARIGATIGAMARATVLGLRSAVARLAVLWTAVTPGVARGIRVAAAGTIRGEIGAATATAVTARRLRHRLARALAHGAAVTGSAAVASLGNAHGGIHAVSTGVTAARATTAAAFISLGRRMHASADRVATGLRHDSPPVVRMAVAGIPAWARQVRLVPALAIVLSAAAGISLAASMLLLSQRQGTRVAAPAASVPAQEPAAPPIALAATPAVELTAPRPSTPAPAAVGTRPSGNRRLNAARVRAVWSKTDTRSLDRALTSLRSATLAFQRCQMRVTSEDRAVAHCDEAPDADRGAPARVAWTIDFRRDDGHWLIDSLSSGRRKAD